MAKSAFPCCAAALMSRTQRKVGCQNIPAISNRRCPAPTASPALPLLEPFASQPGVAGCAPGAGASASRVGCGDRAGGVIVGTEQPTPSALPRHARTPGGGHLERAESDGASHQPAADEQSELRSAPGQGFRGDAWREREGLGGVRLVRGRDEVCPVSTGGGTRRVRLVRVRTGPGFRFGGAGAGPQCRPQRRRGSHTPAVRCREGGGPQR